MPITQEQQEYADSLFSSFQKPGADLPSMLPRGGSGVEGEKLPFPGVGAPPLAEDVFKPDALAHPDNFDKFFQGVRSGAIDALTLGVVREDVPEGMSGSAGQLIGMIAGEIPFFLIGGTIAKAIVKGSVHAARIAAKAPRIFGASVEVATAMGVDVGRSTIGGEEDVFTPLRIGANIALPFAGSLLRKGVKKPKPFSERTWHYKPPQPKKGVLREEDLKAAFRALPEDDAQALIAHADLYSYKSGDPAHINEVMKLARQGADFTDLRNLVHPDDIADYIRFTGMPQGKYPKAINSQWKPRTGDLSAFRNEITSRFRDVPNPPSLKGQIPFQDESEVLKHIGSSNVGIGEDFLGRDVIKPFTPTDPQIPALGAAANLGIRPPRIESDRVIDDVVSSVFPEARIFHPIGGGSGLSAADELEIARELLNSPVMIDIPIDRKSVFVRNYMDKMAGAPIIDRAIVTSIRYLQSIGPEGRQVAELLFGARRWSRARIGMSHADLMNAAEELGTDSAKWVEVTKGLDLGVESSDEAVNNMIKAFRFHTKYISETLDAQGVKILMKDGALQSLLSKPGELGEGAAQKHFFPHKHDWDAVKKDQPLLERIAGVIENDVDLSGVVNKTGLTPKNMVEMYLRKVDNTRMPRFQQLYERNVNLPGWLGDPGTAAARGDSYAVDVMDSMMDYLENAYTMIGHNRHLGAPKGMSWADDLNFWTNLEPIHRKIKGIIEGAEFGIRKGDKGGGTINLQERAQFPNVAAVRDEASKAFARGDRESTAAGILEEVKSKLMIKDTVRDAPWKLQPMLASLAEKGGDLDHAINIIAHVQGAKMYGGGRRTLSRRVRNLNIVTKLGVMVAENVGQISFTMTKMGLRNTYKAVKDVINPKTRKATLESVTRWGVLVEDAVKVLEAESGRNFTGRFLTGIGFRWSEKYLRATAAVAGKYHVEELLTNLAKGPGTTAITRLKWRKTIRQLDKYGFRKQKLIKEGTSDLTPLGQRVVNSVTKEGTDDAMLVAVRELAGFEGSRATQFLADVMDNPSSWQSPEGKILTQFKNFVTNSTKFALRDVLDEIAHGNPGPAVRMLLTGIALGEITQNVKDVVTGRDPLKRGQEGYVRGVVSEMFGLKELPDNDQELFRVLGQKISTNDVAARALENILSVGQMGMFWSMMQSAVSGGTLRVMQFAAGPTIDTGLDVLRGASEALGGDPDRLIRRGLREGLSAAGGGLPGPLPFVSAVVGRHLQQAAVPTKPQQERSLYVTADEAREIAERQVLRRYNNVRAAAVEAVEDGNQEEAIRLASDWNAQLGDEMDQLIIMGAMNMTTAQKISFSHDDILRLLHHQPDVEATTAQRIGGAFQNVQDITRQPVFGTP